MGVDDDGVDVSVFTKPGGGGKDDGGLGQSVKVMDGGIVEKSDVMVNDRGDKVRITRTVRVTRRKEKMHVDVRRRRALAKYGEAKNAKPGPEPGITMVSVENITVEKVNAVTGEAEKPAEGAAGDLEAAVTGGGSLMSCRVCGKKGDHWTSKCPYKELAAEGQVDKPGGEDSLASRLGVGGGSSLGGGAGKFVPSAKRRAAAGEDVRGGRFGDRSDEPTLRVTNLSEDTRDTDLQLLFSPFGRISRIYLATDRQTGASKGFAFINFHSKEDAERAMNKLDGHGFDNLILRVEWAQPSKPRD